MNALLSSVAKIKVATLETNLLEVGLGLFAILLAVATPAIKKAIANR
jgi:hypothetical protein